MSYKRLVARVPLQHCFTNQTFRSITLAHTHTSVCPTDGDAERGGGNEEEKEDEDKAEDDAAGKKTQRS